MLIFENRKLTNKFKGEKNKKFKMVNTFQDHECVVTEMDYSV